MQRSKFSSEKKAEKDKIRLYREKCRQVESSEKAATRKNNDKASNKRKRQSKSTDATFTQKVNESAVMKRRRIDEMPHSIERAMTEAKHILQRTQHPTNPHSHKAIVFIICDRFIIGTEKIHKLSKYQISQHSSRLSVNTYEAYHGVELKEELRKQYRVNDDLLRNLLLSPRSRKYHNGYATCTCCLKGMCQTSINKKSPPKYAIANGFVIGSLPTKIQFTTKDGKRKKRTVELDEVTDIWMRIFLYWRISKIN